MQENTNKAIAVNSIILYVKMGITTICALLTTRFALQALGVVDYGLYSVLGGIISFIGVFNTIMISTSNRYLAVAIGKKDVKETNRVFNVNLSIFLAIVVVTLIISIPIGNWYIHSYVNYDGNINNALIVFYISIVGSILSAIGTPYNGLLVAKEKFIVFSVVDVVTHILKLLVAWILVGYFNNKLFIYTITVAFLTTIPTFVYRNYCRRHYPDIVRWNFVKDKALYSEILGFSGWVAYGAVSCIAKSQGAALLVNAFFNTVMNTALGIANSISSYICIFSQNAIQPMQPQITKSYVAGDKERTDDLLVMSTKFGYLLMLFVAVPFIVSADWLLQLWLGEVPPYAVSFTVLIVIDQLVGAFNNGISNLIFASGKIKMYQLVVNTVRLVSLLLGYIALKMGYPPESLFVSYIIVSVLMVFIIQWVLHKTMKYDNKILIRRSYIPSICVTLLFAMPMYLIHDISVHPIVMMLIAFAYLVSLDFFVGLSKNERNKLKIFIKNAKCRIL